MATVRIWGQIYFGGDPKDQTFVLDSHLFFCFDSDSMWLVADIHRHQCTAGVILHDVLDLTLSGLLRACKGVRMAWMDCDVFSFLFVAYLLSYNSRIIMATILKYTVQWFLVYSQIEAIMANCLIPEHFPPQKRNLVPISSVFSFHLSPRPLAATNLLSTSMNLPVLDMCKGNHA